MPLNLANAQGDEWDAEASCEQAHLRNLEVLQRRATNIINE